MMHSYTYTCTEVRSNVLTWEEVKNSVLTFLCCQQLKYVHSHPVSKELLECQRLFMYKIRWPKIQTKQNNNTNNKNSCSGGEKCNVVQHPHSRFPQEEMHPNIAGWNVHLKQQSILYSNNNKSIALPENWQQQQINSTAWELATTTNQ